ncbi:NAD(P)/FAD-dependent oxidoreductase [Paenibacillus dakarensis]|uniref:NAD(P)/FAD-dependent oxidoreductase n=1 Tax=Paenibacillus dakarensis TaxID=1527293 RepID=UPI0006D52CB2|nr:NAD(P)/FAD-dependent oxidoreductase [Paenibacillus dakarensis]
MRLLEESSIGAMKLKNRIIMAPMGAELGDFDVRTNAYYAARAKGGVAMLMCTVVATEEIEGPSPASKLDENSFEGLQSLVKQCHDYDSKICLQIMPGAGLGGMAPGRTQPVAPSPMQVMPGMDFMFAEMTKEEIGIIHRAVLRTAVLAQKAGVDCIEIHAYGGYLTDKFMSKRWNHRTDEYGGSFENRMRFLTEIIEGVQSELGKDYPLMVKFTPSHYLPVEDGYRGMEEGLEIAKLLESKGVHALHIDAGCHDNWYMAMPPIYQQEVAPQMISAQAVKQVVSIPVLSQGRLENISKAEAALENEWVDLVCMGRGLLADPEIPNKIAQFRTDDIRNCISCNEGCIARVANMPDSKHIECAVNPLTGHEGIRELKRTDNPKRILVIGAGPGGCSAAITAAEAGHTVEVWEKSAQLGGNFRAACMPTFKRDGEQILNYYRSQLNKLGVVVKYCKEATAESILAYGADKVIWAAGGTPVRPASIEGIMGSNVCLATDALRELCLVGDNIVVIGGGLVGCETAINYARKGKKVTIVEMSDKLLPEPLFIQNMMMLSGMLKHPNITSMPATKLSKISQGSVTVESADGVQELPCDTVILAMGFRPNNQVYNELEGKVDIVNVGDSVRARKVYDAVHEAYDAVLSM